MPIKKYLLTGLLVWLPIAITIWVLLWVVGLADGILMGVLTALQALSPGMVSGFLDQFKHIPGLGVLTVFTGLLLTGSLAVSYTHLDVYKRQIFRSAWTRLPLAATFRSTSALLAR